MSKNNGQPNFADQIAAAGKLEPSTPVQNAQSESILNVLDDDFNFAEEDQTLNQMEGEKKVVNKIGGQNVNARNDDDLSAFVSQLPMPTQADFTINDGRRIILKPVIRGSFRVGLESTPEKYNVYPGTTYRFAPDKIGNRYKTGLNRIKDDAGDKTAEGWRSAKQKIADLEFEIGEKLDDNYYGKMSVPLDRNKTAGEIFNLSDARDYVIYLAMLESKLVKAFKDQYGKPEADWYIEDAEQEALVEAKERKVRKDAGRLIETVTEAELRWLAKSVGLEVNNLSELALRSRVDKWLEDGPRDKQQLKALAVMELYGKGKSFVRTLALVKDAASINVITRNNANDYMYGDTILGALDEEVVNKLLNPANQQMLMAIRQRVQNAIAMV